MARHHKSKKHSSAVYRAVAQYDAMPASRDMMQKKDGSMLSQDPSQMAGLPRGVQYKPYPKAEYDLDGDLYGNIVGIDRQMAEDHSALKRINGHPRKI